MGYARHIGRVGALAVTLGVGAAIANAPGVAYAETPGASPGGDQTQKTTTSSTDTSTNQTSPPTGAAADTDDTKPSASDRRSQRRSVVRAVVGAIRDIADGAVAAGGNSAGATTKPEKPSSLGDSSVERKTSSTSTNTTRVRARVTDLADTADDVKTAATSFTQRVEQAVQKYTAPTAAIAPNDAAKAAPQTITTAAVTPQLFPPRARTSVVPLITNALGSVLQPLVSGGGTPGLPQLPTLAVILGAVRDELERTLGARPPQPNYPDHHKRARTNHVLPNPAEQHVLVIAIDGTNMSKVIEDNNTKLRFDLMNTSTVSAPSIVGHTTISNPSWTAILTGAWDNKTGVINNVYTPQTYDRWPSVFTQLENTRIDGYGYLDDGDRRLGRHRRHRRVGRRRRRRRVRTAGTGPMANPTGRRRTRWSRTETVGFWGPNGRLRGRPELHGHLPRSGRRSRAPVRRRFAGVRRRRLRTPTTISARSWRGGAGRCAGQRHGRELDRHRRHRPRSPTAARASGTASNHPARQRRSSSSTARNSRRLQHAINRVRQVQSGLRDRRRHADGLEPVRRPAGPQVRRRAAAVAQRQQLASSFAS